MQWLAVHNEGGIQMKMNKKGTWLWLLVLMCILSSNGTAEAAVQSNQTKSDTMNYKEYLGVL